MRRSLVLCSMVAASIGATVLAGSGSARAATFTVTNTNAAGAGSLHQAILDAGANPGPDTVSIPAGTYPLNGLVGLSDGTTIAGAGASVTTIQGDATDTMFQVSGPASVTIEGVTITGAADNNQSGGVIRAFGGTDPAFRVDLTIRDSVFTGNAATTGGAVAHANGLLTIENSVFADNDTLQGGGGAINTLGSVISITDSTFIGNGAASVPNGDPANGGAILVSGGRFDVTRSTFSGNTAGNGPGDDANGGAIFVTGSPDVNSTIVNSTISGNTAFGNGGGIGVELIPLLNLVHTTVAQNVAVGAGAGIFARDEGTVSLSHSLVHNNQSDTPENCATSPGANTDGTIESLGGNLSDDDTCAAAFTDPTDRNGDAGTALLDLADNGGTTQTHALQTGSSAIDAVACADGVSEDQRGEARPEGALCDIGAYEGAAGPVITTTTTTAPGGSTTSTTVGGATTSTSTGGASGPSTTGSGAAGTGSSRTGGGTGSLATTGSSSTEPTARVASVLLLVGAALLVIAARRRRSPGWTHLRR
jgi:hypothetical protein